VKYSINAWMNLDVPVDRERALLQWEHLRATYERLGHRVEVLDAVPGLPDMVFAANGAFSVGGVVYGARFAFAERAAEAPAHRRWYAGHGWGQFTAPGYVNEGEGDFTFLPGGEAPESKTVHAETTDPETTGPELPGRGLVLAGYGFRTELTAHAEAAAVLGRPVISLELVDPRFYHLDTALFVLDDENICYFPGAFSARSRALLQELFPEAVEASEADAMAFGLNAVSDGRHVVLPTEATELADRLHGLGYVPVPVDLSEFHKGGGSVKCCTAELRS
jgi:N-dimethylarginine dimethylaminohydrolase